MKQLLVENCILLNDKLFNFEGKTYTVKQFLELLRGIGKMRAVKKMILQKYGKRFENKDEVLTCMTGVAHELLELIKNSEDVRLGIPKSTELEFKD